MSRKRHDFSMSFFGAGWKNHGLIFLGRKAAMMWMYGAADNAGWKDNYRVIGESCEDGF